MNPLAYHITWGTYGTRLRHGPRPTVSRNQNDPSSPVLAYDEHLWEREKANLKYPSVILTPEQMRFAEETIPQLCARGYWTHHACAAGPDHVHTVLTSNHDPETIRRLLKRWLGQALSDPWPLLPRGRTWWAECGSFKWILDTGYFTNATRYVIDQRATPSPR